MILSIKLYKIRSFPHTNKLTLIYVIFRVKSANFGQTRNINRQIQEFTEVRRVILCKLKMGQKNLISIIH